MSPWLVKRILFPLQERLKGKATFRHLRQLERTQWLDLTALEELQFQRLRQHLEYAYREVPYYTRLLDEHELPPRRIQSFADFARVPYLTKEIIRRHFSDLQPRTQFRGVHPLSTGGSTGSPVTVLVDRERAAFTDATRLRAHSWYGLDVGAREIVLWGSPIDLTKQDVVRAIRDRLMNSRLLSAFDLGEEQFSRYAAVLRRDRPLRLYGYASALYLFARYLSRSGWKAEGGWPRVVFTTAEPLYDFQRATIESVFGCPAAVEYGSRDAGLTANECPAGGLHIAAEGMVVEVASAGCGARPSELVITNLYAYAMPIIRYRVGDLGVLDDTPCRCGRGLPCLRSIEGRRTDFLVLPNGRILHALAVIYILREIEFIDEFQVIQDRYDRLRVALVAAAGLSGPTLEMIRSKIEHLCEGTVSVEIEVTDAIAWSGGKHRYVVSTVADAYLETLLTPKP